MLRNSLKVLLLISLLFILAACGGDGDDDGGDSNDSGNSASSVDLSQTATATQPDAGITFTVNYPEGWVSADNAGSLGISNNEDLLAAAQEDSMTVEDGQIVIIGLPLVGDDAVALGLTEDSTPGDAVDIVSGLFFGGPDTETNFNEPENVELNGKSATIVSGTATMNGNEGDGSIMAIAVDGGYAVFIARYSGDFNDELRAILGTAQVTTAE